MTDIRKGPATEAVRKYFAQAGLILRKSHSAKCDLVADGWSVYVMYSTTPAKMRWSHLRTAYNNMPADVERIIVVRTTNSTDVGKWDVYMDFGTLNRLVTGVPGTTGPRVRAPLADIVDGIPRNGSPETPG